jgi:hypothetical protein
MRTTPSTAQRMLEIAASMHTHTIDRHVKYDIILLLFELVELQKTPAAYLGVAPDDRRRRISGSGQRGASRKPSPGRAVTGVVVLRYCCLGYETGGPVGIYNVTAEYSSEMERMMKVQDVLLKAMARKITRWAAAEILGVTDRTMRRWRERLEKDGYSVRMIWRGFSVQGRQFKLGLGVLCVGGDEPMATVSPSRRTDWYNQRRSGVNSPTNASEQNTCGRNAAEA